MDPMRTGRRIVSARHARARTAIARQAGLAALCIAALAALGGETDACDTGTFALRADYSGARLSGCRVLGASEVVADIAPEDGGRINPSPWYGFHVRALRANAGELRVQLRYGEHEHRYPPKISVDGESWQPLAAADSEVDANGAAFRLQPNAGGLYVSAQENWNVAFYDEWRKGIAEKASASWFEIGRSLQGRPIWAMHVGSDAPAYLLLLGRQHPPEVSGAHAFLRFVEQLLEAQGECPAPTPRCRFLGSHGLVLVPLLNPDGVANGHWRHNAGHTDLNRDWGPFTQPETQAVRDLVAELERRRKRPRLVLDFHSTRRNVFYTQDADAPTRPPEFAANWLAAVQGRQGLYAFENAPRPLRELGTAKNYFHRRFGIPSITYEVADEEDRALVRSSAAAFAEALVDVLAAADAEAPPCADQFCHLLAANQASLVMLAEEGLLPARRAAAIAAALAWVEEEQARPGARRSANYLDIEQRLIELVGVEAADIHVGRSRQDLHGTARRMAAREHWLRTAQGMAQARRALIEQAEAAANAPVPAYTHGVPAQPTTFGHVLLAFSAALERDLQRIREGYARLNQSPLGAAALGTSGFPLNRHRLAALLGFSAPLANSFDANLVASADYKLEFAAMLAQSAIVVGQFAQHIHAQYDDPQPWIVLNAATTSGSSIMPQKRNPRPLDRLRSAASMTVAQAQEVVLLAHNANTGMHDYRQIAPLLALADQGDALYRRYAALVESIELDSDRALEEIGRGFSTMTEVADVLAREAGVPFRAAHGYAAALVDACRASNRRAAELTDAELRRLYADTVGGRLPLSPGRLRQAMDPAALIAGRKGFGGPQPAEMERALAAHREALAGHEAWREATESALRQARSTLRETFAAVAARSAMP